MGTAGQDAYRYGAQDPNIQLPTSNYQGRDGSRDAPGTRRQGCLRYEGSSIQHPGKGTGAHGVTRPTLGGEEAWRVGAKPPKRPELHERFASGSEASKPARENHV